MSIDNTDAHQARNVKDVVLVQDVSKDLAIDQIS